MANSPERDTQDLPLLQEARLLWSQKRWSDALERFEAAHAASPQNLRATIELARALGQRYQIERAECLLHHAWEKAGVDLQLASAIAQSYRLIHRPLKAIEVLEAIRTTETVPPALLGELSVLYEQTNRMDEARVTIRECVESAPGQPEPMLLRARIERVAGNASHSRRILEGLLKSSQLSPLLVARAWSEVSQVADAQGEYREAMEAVERSKDVLRRQPRVDLLLQRNAALNQCLQGIHSQLDTSTLDDWRAAYRHLEKPFPNVAHLLGFPRSGTTLLEQIMESHPGLASSSELPVFSREIFPEIYRSDRFRELSFDSLRYVDEELLMVLRLRYLDYLQAVLGQSLEGRVHLDKNPNHTGLIAGLLRLFPDSHFVFAVRDPRDVVLSAYMQYFPLTEFSASLLTFESAVAQYANDMEIGLRVAGLIPEQWTPVRYEDVVRDWDAEVRRVLSRLGLSWDPAIEGYRERIQQAIINSPSQASVRQPIYARSMGRWKNYEAYLRPWLQNLNRYCVAFGYESA